MEEYTFGVYHRPRSQVIHRVRIDWGLGRILLSCQYELIDFSSKHVYENLRFNERSLRKFKSIDKGVYALCFHCMDRQPSWERAHE